MANAANLLGLAIFQYQHFLNFQPRIVVASLIRGDYLEANFFGEDFDRILSFLLIGSWRRGWLRSLSWRSAGGWR